MSQWIIKLDDFLRLMDRDVLAHAGKVSHEKALAKAYAEYERFRQVLDELPSAAEKDYEAASDLTPLLEVEKRGRKARKGGGDAA